MLKDPIRKAFLTIDRDIAAHLQKISDRAFKGVEADLPPEEVLPIDQRTAAHPTAAPTPGAKDRSERQRK